MMKGNNKGNGEMLPLVEDFYSIQGEGFHTGKAAYFIRIGGCDVGCSWCDTRFAWNADIHPMTSTAEIVKRAVGSGADSVVVTGGEPLMWNLGPLTDGLKRNDICTFMETSGAYPLSGKWDWICLSPKRNMPPSRAICRSADELKVIIESSDDLEWAEKCRENVSRKCRLFLQPEWSRFEKIIPEIVDYVRKNPVWRISLQVHKYMHIP
ncbi:MAG: 7-carboxy-7-deazaguanine synthase QueE [Bacteroidales bacterium]|jgi:organic radical activating enzyme|nr:7-carboxy-7-deazaguanine synthase QueE [Bacteroidales bacterium]